MAIDFNNLQEGQLEVVNELARESGWVPLEEWKGKPEDHRSAVDYLRNSKKVINNQKVSKRNLEKEVADLHQKLDAVEQRHQQQTMAELDSIRTQLKDQMRDAVAAGDTEQYAKIEKQLDKVEEKHRATAVAQQTTGDKYDPLFVNWLEQNGEWYETDAAMTAEADKFTNNLADDLPLSEKLASVDIYMRGKYPERFNGGGFHQEPESDVSDAEKGGGSARAGGKITYESLGKAGQATCDSYVAMGLGTREKYLKDIQEQEESMSKSEW